jgi:hypothetical protein
VLVRVAEDFVNALVLSFPYSYSPPAKPNTAKLTAMTA